MSEERNIMFAGEFVSQADLDALRVVLESTVEMTQAQPEEGDK